MITSRPPTAVTTPSLMPAAASAVRIASATMPDPSLHFDDRIGEERCDRDLHELRIATVIDDCYLISSDPISSPIVVFLRPKSAMMEAVRGGVYCWYWTWT